MCCRHPINQSVLFGLTPTPGLELHCSPQKMKTLSYLWVNTSKKKKTKRRNEIPLLPESSNSINVYNPHLMRCPLKNKDSYYLAGLMGGLKRIASGLQHQIKTDWDDLLTCHRNSSDTAAPGPVTDYGKKLVATGFSPLPPKTSDQDKHCLQYSFSNAAEHKHFGHKPPARDGTSWLGDIQEMAPSTSAGQSAHQISPALTHKWGTGWGGIFQAREVGIQLAAHDDSGLLKLKVCYIGC